MFGFVIYYLIIVTLNGSYPDVLWLRMGKVTADHIANITFEHVYPRYFVLHIFEHIENTNFQAWTKMFCDIFCCVIFVPGGQNVGLCNLLLTHISSVSSGYPHLFS